MKSQTVTKWLKMWSLKFKKIVNRFPHKIIIILFLPLHFYFISNTMTTIEALKQKLYSIEIAEKRLALLNHEMDALQYDLNILQNSIDKEYKDLAKLEKIPTLKIFKKIMGDIEKKLDKEKEEYYQAVLKYDDCANKIQILEFEKDILINKINSKGQVFKDLETAIIASRENPLSKHPLSDSIVNFETQIGLKEKLVVEINEAMFAADQLIKYLGVVAKNLASFESVSNNGLQLLMYDQLQQVKNIRKVVSIIDSLEQNLNKELEDIQNGLRSKNLYTPFISFFETLQSSLIAGWVSGTHLSHSKKCINNNIANTKEIKNFLKKGLNDANNEIEMLRKEKLFYLSNL